MEPNLHRRHYVVNHYTINTPRFADDQALIADSEDNLIIYREEYSHYKTANNFGMVISSEISETMAIL